MKKTPAILAALLCQVTLTLTPMSAQNDNILELQDTPLKKLFQDIANPLVYYGVDQLESINDLAHLTHHYSGIIDPYAFSWSTIQPSEGRFDFGLANLMADFAQKNNLTLTTGYLLGRYELPSWLETDAQGEPASKELLTQRLLTHCQKVATAFRGKVDHYLLTGETFEAAAHPENQHIFERELGYGYLVLMAKAIKDADPKAKIYLSDYAFHETAPMELYRNLLREFRKAGTSLDGVYYSLGATLPDLTGNYGKRLMKGYEDALKELRQLKLETNLFLFDLPVYGYEDQGTQYNQGLPKDIIEGQAKQYYQLIKLAKKYHKSITNIHFGFLNDSLSYRNEAAEGKRLSHAGLFGHDGQAKPIFEYLESKLGE